LEPAAEVLRRCPRQVAALVRFIEDPKLLGLEW
jgi:hypothetical protein